MRTYKYETFTVTEERKSQEICTCDVCGTVIFRKSLKPGIGRSIPVDYWHIDTWHTDWGNDSCDSAECYDVCSEKCLKEKFTEYLSITNGKRSSQCFNIEHKSGLEFVV